jgi:hypothetical protein
MLPRVLRHHIAGWFKLVRLHAKAELLVSGEGVSKEGIGLSHFFPQKLYPGHKSVLECTEEPFDAGFGLSRAQNGSIFYTLQGLSSLGKLLLSCQLIFQGPDVIISVEV